MTPQQVKDFIQEIIPVLLKAGELAVASQGKVANIGKQVAHDERLPEWIKQEHQAKTEIDEKVQEMILVAVQGIFGINGVKIDGEEDTPTKKLFTDKTASTTIIIDPIDGTLQYLNGSRWFSVNIGVVQNGNIVTSLVYFPITRKLYYLDEHKTPYLAIYKSDLQMETRQELTHPKNPDVRHVYTNNRVPLEAIASLKKNGYIVIQDDGKVTWLEAQLNCLSGKFAACIFKSPQIRDVLLGSLIQKMPRGYAVGWDGGDIAWPDGGRLTSVFFGFGELSDKIKNSLH